MNGIEPNGAIVSYGVLFCLKAVLLVGVGFLASVSFRKTSASLRHLVWSATFVALLALPAAAGLSLVASDFHIPIALFPASLEPGAVPTQALDAAPAPAPSDSPRHGGVEAPSERPGLGWSTLAGVVWVCGAALFLGRLGAGIVASIREVLRAKELSDDGWSELLDTACSRLDVWEEVSLRMSDRPLLPMTLGLFHPTILLPESAGSYATSRRWAVLLHELAHVRRRDCLTQFLAQTVSAIYWWNPLVWLAAREMRLLSERASDDLVLTTGASPADYAHDLLEMARGLHEERFTPLASVAMAHRSRFEERLLAILDPGVARRVVSRRWAFGASLFALPVFLFVALAVPTRAARIEPVEREVKAVAVPVESQEETSPEPEPESETKPAPQTTPSPTPVPEKRKSKPKVTPEARDKARAALAEALDDPDPSVQQQALHALIQMGDMTVAPHLAHALESGDPETRAEAAWGLGRLQDASSVASLQKALSDDNAEVREQAAWALGMIRDPSAVPGLARAVGDTDENVREQAAWALGMLRAPEGYDSLLTALSDQSSSVREQAAWALGMLRDSRAIEALSRALKDEEADVREQAAWALGRLANDEADTPHPDPDPRPHVRELQDEPGFTPGTVL